MANAPAEILFIYNADGGVLNGVKDLLWKTFAPATYPCSLCAVSYGPFGMRREWRSAVASLPLPVRFLHRDEVGDLSLASVALPVAIIRARGESAVWISASELDACRNLPELIGLLRRPILEMR